MLQTDQPARLRTIMAEASALSHDETLELIAYLAQRAKQTAVMEKTPVYTWRDIVGIAPDLLEGQDAQAWVNKMRAEEWNRERHH